MKTIKINANDSGQRLDSFLKKLMPSAPFSLLYKYLRTNKIKLNRKKVPPDTRIAEGDVLDYYGDEALWEIKAFVPGKYSLDIIYEDENIILINKPACLACQPDENHRSGTLVDFVKSYLFEKGEYKPENEHSFSPALCNRLDFNTSGIVIAAKNGESLRILNKKIRNKEVRKFYLCRVTGIPDPPKGVITEPLKKDEKANITKVSDKGKPAETHYRMLSTDGKNSTLEIELITGRSHQIRVHLKSIGCPILGDAKYGAGGSGQELCAYKVQFDFKSPSGKLAYLDGLTFKVDA